MLRRTLTTLTLGLIVVAGPCLVSADTSPKKSPPKLPTKPSPQIIQPPAPTTSTRRRQLQTHSKQGYHPHQAKGASKYSKPNTH